MIRWIATPPPEAEPRKLSDRHCMAVSRLSLLPSYLVVDHSLASAPQHTIPAMPLEDTTVFSRRWANLSTHHDAPMITGAGGFI